MILAGFMDRLPYREGVALQEALRLRAAADPARGFLLLLEHPPVLTKGRRVTGDAGLLVPRERLAALGIEVHAADRGGEWTYHGPGQLVAYPVLHLAARRLGVKRFVQILEETMIRFLGDFGVAAERRADRPGVYAAGAKIGFVGLNVRGGVTGHGIAVNLATDPAPFGLIVPCGMPGARVTSVAEVTGVRVPLADAARRLGRAFGSILGEEVRWTAPARVRALAEGRERRVALG